MKTILIGKWIPYGDEFLWDSDIDGDDEVFWVRKKVRLWQVLRDIGIFKSASEAQRAGYPEYSPDGWQEYEHGKSWLWFDVLTYDTSFLKFLWASLNRNLFKSILLRHTSYQFRWLHKLNWTS